MHSKLPKKLLPGCKVCPRRRMQFYVMTADFAGGLIITGPTGTNVNDVAIVLLR